MLRDPAALRAWALEMVPDTIAEAWSIAMICLVGGFAVSCIQVRAGENCGIFLCGVVQRHNGGWQAVPPHSLHLSWLRLLSQAACCMVPGRPPKVLPSEAPFPMHARSPSPCTGPGAGVQGGGGCQAAETEAEGGGKAPIAAGGGPEESIIAGSR